MWGNVGKFLLALGFISFVLFRPQLQIVWNRFLYGPLPIESAFPDLQKQPAASD